VQNVIANTTTPAWVNHVPKNYGEKGAGSMKADEWRLLATIYLPIALILLWGKQSGVKAEHGDVPGHYHPLSLHFDARTRLDIPGLHQGMGGQSVLAFPPYQSRKKEDQRPYGFSPIRLPPSFWTGLVVVVLPSGTTYRYFAAVQ